VPEQHVCQQTLEIAAMSHSHLGARYLLTQIETDRSRRTNRDKLPDWLNGLIEEAAGSFEPLAGVARVGYECVPDEGGWHISLYLGAVEMVGGKADGHSRAPDFRCDLKRLLEQFVRIDELEWTVSPQSSLSGNSCEQSLITIGGLVGASRVWLSVRSSAPEAVGPGLREFPDGRVESV
jgi:hypothetical protein